MTQGPGELARAAREGRRPTVRDVAEAAGVSRSTASRALTGTGYVGHGVRDRVQHAAEALGYVPDAMARGLKQRVSRSIGVLLPDLRDAAAADVVAGAVREARRRGYATILGPDLEVGAGGLQAAERFVALRVAGVVVVPVSAEVTDYLARRRTPVVEVDRHFGHGPADAVVVDDARLARELTGHLLGLGHRRIVLLLDRPAWTTGHDRRTGFLAAYGDAGLDPDDAVVVPAADPEEGEALVASLLTAPSPPTALVTAGERMTAAVWRVVARLGLRVPEHLSVVALEDAPWMAMVSPPVTAVDRDPVGQGRAAVARLLERLGADGVQGDEGADGAPSVVRPRVVHRGSTAPRAG